MDGQQTGSATGPAPERGPSFVGDVVNLTERVVDGVEDDVETLAGKVLGTGEKVVSDAAAAAQATLSSNAAAIDAIKQLGDVHLTIGKVDVNEEITKAKQFVEAAIIKVARHLGSLA